jgi:hypothetical protein
MAIINQHDKRSNITYVYKSTSYWDKTKKQPRAKRTLIGKRDPNTNQIIPTDGRGKKRQNKTQPPQTTPQTTTNPTPTQPTTQTRKYYGTTYLLDQIAQKLKLDQDLKTTFPQTYKQILSLAYYIAQEDNSPLYRFEKWSTTHKHPHNTNIPSQHISEIFTNITQPQKNQFLNHFATRHAKKECWLYDTTSISSYSQTLKQVQWGKNKENDNLPQINLALAYGEDTNLPFYYRKLAKNIADVSTIKNLLADFEALGFNKPKLVLDRGFYSKTNVDLLLKDNTGFLMALKISLKFVRKSIEDMYEKIKHFEHYSEQYELYGVTVPLEWHLGKKRSGGEGCQIYLHLYYDIERAAEEAKSFDRQLSEMYRELLCGKHNPWHVKGYERFFVVCVSGEGKRVVVVNEGAVAGAKRYFGFFALLSCDGMDAVGALELYLNRGLVEKVFGNILDRLSLRRVLVSCEQSLDGGLFVCYVGLIFLSYIKRCMAEVGLFVEFSVQGLLDRLDVVECFEGGGLSVRVGEVTERQRALYVALGVDPPT